ncbi:MAG: hypothetical protein LC623_07585 [Halobacteriales archaeon]|nr:hypothetical protein [Halobacteriales archaeon]
MLTTTLALDLVANLLSCVIYLAVARIVAARPVDAKAVSARRAFAWWWDVLALLALYGAFADAVTMAGAWTVPLLVAAVHVLLLAILLGLAGLLYYLVYLYTGREGAWKPIVLFYGLFWAFLVYWIEALQPNGIQPGVITPQLSYVHDPKDSAFGPLLGLLLILPIIGGAVGYFTLFFRAHETTQRYRIAVVSLSILLWFSFSLVGSLLEVNQSLAWTILSRTISLAAALCVYGAYRPPRWVQRRWGVQGVGS